MGKVPPAVIVIEKCFETKPVCSVAHAKDLTWNAAIHTTFYQVLHFWRDSSCVVDWSRRKMQDRPPV